MSPQLPLVTLFNMSPRYITIPVRRTFTLQSKVVLKAIQWYELITTIVMEYFNGFLKKNMLDLYKKSCKVLLKISSFFRCIKRGRPYHPLNLKRFYWYKQLFKVNFTPLRTNFLVILTISKAVKDLINSLFVKDLYNHRNYWHKFDSLNLT